jgi:hypothetical protein
MLRFVGPEIIQCTENPRCYRLVPGKPANADYALSRRAVQIPETKPAAPQQHRHGHLANKMFKYKHFKSLDSKGRTPKSEGPKLCEMRELREWRELIRIRTPT